MVWALICKVLVTVELPATVVVGETVIVAETGVRTISEPMPVPPGIGMPAISVTVTTSL